MLWIRDSGEKAKGGAEVSENLLTIRGLETHFRSGKREHTKVLDGVSLTVKRGEIIGLVGESGSGKSITMLSALQLLPGNGYIAGGEVILEDNGQNILDNKPTGKAMRQIRGGRIGMIFQEPMTSLNPVMPVGEQIAEACIEHLGMNKKDAKAKAIEMMELVKIPDAKQRYGEYPMQFSGGMRQRIMIAMVLAAQPDVLIADEATTALDVTTQAILLEMIKELSQKTGVAVVIVTHNLGIVARYADRIYVMYCGNIVETGTAMEIFHESRHPYTRSLLRAIPRLDDPKDRILVPIEGMPPVAANRTFFCQFYPRCKYACAECKEKNNPELREVSEGHFVACHLDAEELERKQAEICNAVLSARPEKKILDEVCLEVKDVKKTFSIYKGMMKRKIAEFNAIEDISFVLHRGETIGIVGESGCGKTTLARTLMRMYKPDGGSIKLFDTDISTLSEKKLRPHHKRMAMVFQDPSSSLDPRMSAGRSVAEPILAHKICKTKEELDARVDSLFRMVGLDPDLKDRYPHEFSGGQRQRIGIARALACDPDILLLDEPISALDVSIQAQVINLLEEIQSQRGLAYLFIAHDLSVVKHISDRVIVMYLGRIMEIASADQLYANPLHPYTQALLSAVPIADPVVEKTREFIGLQGEVPSVLSKPRGCPFSNRCKYADQRCFNEVPPPADRGGGHLVACFSYQEVKLI